MDERIVLSLCILTYNQPESVESFFESVKDQVTDEVEILIRDDSPNNQTELVVKKYASQLPIPIRYFKGEKKKAGGYDTALLFLTGEAKGKYLWWYGDDVMVPDAITRILTVAKANPNLSFIWLNARDINDANYLSLNLGGNKFFKNASELFEINVGLLGFPSATVLNRQQALPNVAGAQKFIGTTLTGYYLILCVVTQGNRESLFLQDPCFLCVPKPSGEARWYDSFQVHGINYALIAQDFKSKLNRVSMRKGLAAQFGRSWRAVIVERARGFKTGFASPGPKIWKMMRLYWSYPEFYIAFPLMLIPRSILRILYIIYKKVRNFRGQAFVRSY